MDGDAPEPIEVELVAHEPSSTSGRWRREPDASGAADRPDGDGPERSERPATDRSRLLAVAAVTAVLALALGWIVGRSTDGDEATDDPAAARPTTTTVPGPLATLPIVGDEIDGAEFDEPDEGEQPAVPAPPGPTTTQPDAEPDAGPTTEPIAVDERLAGVPVRLVGIELGGVLVEADLAAGTLTDFRVGRIVSDGTPLVVGSDWVVASPTNGRARVIWSDGTESSLPLGDYWRLLAVPGTDLFWRGSFGPGPAGVGEFELVDLAGDPLGPLIEMPTNSWPVLVDPRSGGLVVAVAGRSYVLLEDGVEYLGAGQVIDVSEDVVVRYDCDETLVCSLRRTDRATGEVTVVPPDPDRDENLRWDSMADWGAADSTISPDGRWSAVIGSSWRSSTSGIVDLASGRFVELAEITGPPSIAWSPDGRWVFYVDDQVPTAYDTVTGDRFPVFTDVVQWLQLGVRPAVDATPEPAADGPTLLSAVPQQPIEG